MLAGERAAEAEGLAEEGGDGAVDGGALRVVVPEDVDVQVAVARVAVGGHHQRLARGDGAHAVEEARDAGARHDDVLRELRTGAGPERPAHHAAHAPEGLALGGRAGGADGGGLRGEARVGHALGGAVDGGGVVAVALDHEHGGGARGEARGLGGAHHGAAHVVEELDAARLVALRDDARDGLARVGEGREARHEGAHLRRQRHEAQRERGEHRERPLAPDEERGEVVAGDPFGGAAADGEEWCRRGRRRPCRGRSRASRRT